MVRLLLISQSASLIVHPPQYADSKPPGQSFSFSAAKVIPGSSRTNKVEPQAVMGKIMGHRTKRILRIERKEYQTY